MAGLVALALASTTAAVVAMKQRNLAIAQARIALSRQLAAEALVSDTRLDVAFLLAAPAHRLRVRLKTSSWITKLSHHEADGREFQEREGIAVEIFPVLCEAATTVEPRNRAFDDPALG